MKVEQAPPEIGSIVEGVRTGDLAAMGRALSAIELQGAEGSALLGMLGAPLNRPLVIALTGPPGAGKSTLCGLLVERWCDDGRCVAALLVDPSSPLTGGAVLGDRVRIRRRADRRLFVRSLASKHRRDGLAPALDGAVAVLAAAGTDLVVLETVGTGQVESGAVGTADVVVMVHPPGLGDEVQAMKAGALELADCFVVSKSDVDGSAAAAAGFEEMVHRSSRPNRPVWRCSSSGHGVDEVAVGVLKLAGGSAFKTVPTHGVAANLMRAALQAAVDDQLGTPAGEALVDELVSDVAIGRIRSDEVAAVGIARLANLASKV